MSISPSIRKRSQRVLPLAFVTLGAFLISSASLASEAPAAGSITAGVSVDRLSKGYDEWSSQFLSYDRRIGNHVISLSGTHHDRGSIEGEELFFSHYLSRPEGDVDLSYRLQVGDGAAWAKTGARAAVHWRAGDGWIGTVGASYRDFESAESKSAFVEIERYVGNERFAFKIEKDVSAGADDNVRMYQATWSHYYDSGAQAALTLASGKELNRDFGRVLAPSEVLTVAVHGVVPLTKEVDILPALSWTKQDQAYERVTASIGVRYKF